MGTSVELRKVALVQVSCLTVSDEKEREVGVRMATGRRRILFSVRKSGNLSRLIGGVQTG